MGTTNNVLVLDDNTRLRQTLCDVLEAKGYVSVSVATGAAALDYVEKEKPSVALIDLKLGDISGIDVLRGIKKVSPGTECIVITGHASQDWAIEAVNLGAYSFIEKPYEMDELLLTVRRAIEKRDAEEALRRSEARFRTIFEQAAVGVALIESKTGRFRRINRSYCEMVGYSVEVMLEDKTFQDITHPDDLPADLENMARLLAGEIREFSMEKRYFHKDGSIVWVNLTVSPSWSIGEEPEYHIAVVEDITERKRAEQSLRGLNDQLQTNIAQMPIAYILWDSQFRVSEWNASAERIFGYSREEILGKCAVDYIVPEPARPLVYEVIEKLLSGEEASFSEEENNIRKDGAVITCEWYNTPLKDATGTTVAILSMAIDITERRHAEEKLIRQQKTITLNNHIANVFLSSLPAKIYADVLDVILEALESRLGYFGYIDDAGDLVCPSMTHNVWDQREAGDESMVFRRAAWGGLWGRSLTAKRTLLANEGPELPEGHAVVENTLAVPIVHQNVLIGQFVVADKPGGYDVFDPELLESAAAQTAPVLNALLAEVRQKREHEKLEAQLQRAAKMEAIGTLTGGIAHDFNNILQSLLGFCRLAQDSGLDDRDLLTECLREIEVGGQRAAEMVAQLLTFSRVEKVEREFCRIEPVVREALTLLRGSLPATTEIRTEFSDDCYPIFADATQIHQIVVNLCTNANHAMEKDGGILLVETRNISFSQEAILSSGPLEAGEYVMLAVKDSGRGIRPDDLERLFEPFFTTRQAEGGSGLGLSTVHGIAKSMNGGVDVESKFGEGAQFKVFLPRYQGVEATQAPAGGGTEGRSPGSAHVLLVDDESAIANMMALSLERLGYTVDAFTSPDEAIAAFQDGPDRYDIVITDMTMPRVTGIEFSRWVRSINGKVPILLATGQLKADVSVSDEISEVIRKPFDMDILVETIERHIGIPQAHST